MMAMFGIQTRERRRTDGGRLARAEVKKNSTKVAFVLYLVYTPADKKTWWWNEEVQEHAEED